MKRIHYISGTVISTFILLHLCNHLWSLAGIEAHIALMEQLRLVYRNVFIESIIVSAVLVQVVSGIKLFLNRNKGVSTPFKKIQLWSGLYLAFFFLVHLSAVFMGRLVMQLDTNLYFGAAGLNNFPLNLFFIPYYVLAIVSFFGHLSALHHYKMKHSILGLSTKNQSYVIIAIGVGTATAVLIGLTNGFKGIELPAVYEVLLGR